MPAETKLFLVCRKTGKIVGFNRRGWRFKVLFPLLGVLALIWYLVRVLPKPSRASYPCQRVGAPIAFGGLAYLLSVCGLATAWHHGRKFIRQNRYTLAGACLVVGLVCGAMVRNYCESRAMAATESTGSFVPVDPPDTPIGTARGIYPGRVAWSYNTNACNWDGVSSYWWSTQFNNQTEITKLMDNVICSVAGQQSVSNAWDALFRAKNGGPTAPSYVKGQSIVIKINENNGGDSNMIDASPQSVYALLDSLVNQFGASQSDITICDPARAGDNAAVLAYCQSAFPNVNLNTSSAGNFTANAFAYSVNFSGTTGTIENSMATAVVNAKYLITMALLKRHAMPYPTYGDSFNDGNAPATMIFKSDWGIIGNNRSDQHVMLHTWEKANASYDLLVDIYGSTNINGKTVLTLLDGLYSGFLWNSGPTNWVIPPFNGHYPSSMFASQDPVALESVGIDFMWANFGMVSNADRTVREAALANNPPSGTVYQPDGVRLKSLGVHENWNNATNKQFSRNLGTGLGIELVTIKPGVPSVSILGMASGNTYTPGTNLPLQALVLNTNYPVSQVAYYQGGQLLGTATTSPYTVTLTNMALGNYAFTAVATDTSGLAVTSNPVNINVSVYTGPVTYTWDAGSGHSGGNDGGGSWDLATADWWNGTTNVVWSNTTQPALTSFGVSNGPAGTVTLGSSITVSNLNFSPAASGNYTLAGGGTLTFANDPTLSVAANCAPVISAPVTGAGFIYAGPGALTLSGANTLSGTLAVTGGTLALIGNNTGSTAGGTVVGGATLQVANGFTGPLTLNSGSILQLRGDANTSFSPSAITLDNASDIYNFDAGPLTTATGNTLTLNGALVFGASANQRINLTGSNTYTLALGNLIGTTTGHNPYVDIALNTLANGPAVTIGTFQSGNWSQWLQLQGGGRITITGNITNVSNGSSIVYVTDGTTATMQGRSSFSPTATATADAYKYCVANGTLVLDNGYALTNNTSGTGLTASYFLLGAATNVFAVSGTFSAPAGVMVNTNNSWNAAVYLGDSTHLTGGITLNAKATNNVSDGDIGFVNSGVMTIGGQNTSGTNTYANTIILGLTANKGKSATLVAATGGEVDFAGPILANGTDTTAGITVGDALHGGTVKLLAANTYAGPTTVSNGTLLVNGSIGAGRVNILNGGTLGGSGTLNGVVTNQAGGSLIPGKGLAAAGAVLTLRNNLVLTAGSFTTLAVSHSRGVNDQIDPVTVTYGGTLNVITNAGDTPFVLGNTVQLFKASSQYLGSFSTLNLPPLTPGLVWSNSLAVNGTLTVMPLIKTTPTITTVPTASPITYGQTLASSSLSGGAASVPGGFTFTTPTTAPGTGTSAQSVTFTPTDTIDYNTVTLSVSVTVNKATPTITTLPAAGAITYGQTLASSTLTGGAASVPGGFAFTAPATAPGAGTATASVTFTPSDTTDYNNAFTSVSVTVNLATATVTWTNPPALTYGTPLGTNQLNATAGVPGGFTYTPPAGTVLDTGTNTLTAVFTPSDTVDYNSATTSVSQVVLPAPLTVTANNCCCAYGQALPVLCGNITGIQNGDNLTATYATTAIVGSPAGNYPIIPALVDLAGVLTNYLVTTNDGTLVIGYPPQINTQPTNQIVPAGGTAQFSVDATGTANPAYQWWFNQTNLLAAATNATLTLTNVTPAQTGGYSVEVLNEFGTLTSTAAVLTVISAPVISGLSAWSSATNPVTGSQSVTLAAAVNPDNLPAIVLFQYGLTTNYAGAGAPIALPAGGAPVNLTAALDSVVPGVVYHWDVIASNSLGLTGSPDQTFYTPSIYPPGVTNASGIVNQAELNAVLANYWPNSPWVTMTNTAGLGSVNVQFGLTNAANWTFSVLVSTNLVDWQYLGPATPLYQFTDPQATNQPARYYRLQWP